VLRSELGDEAVRRRGDSDVAIDETLISCDVVAFELAVEAGDYERALELYRGDLLEGLFVREAPEFERWLDDERTRLREMAAGAAWALAHQHIGAGRLVGAERTAQRALLLVATDESEVRRFIQALAEAGDRAAAVRFYEKFAQRLRSEYEIEPDPSTVAVSQALVNAAAHPHQVDKTTGEAIAAEQLRPVAPSDSTTPTDARPSENAFMRSRKVQIGVAVATVATLVLAAALLLPRWSGRTLFPDRVIVVAFTDESGLEEAYALGRMAQDYIIDILTEAGFADVFDPQAVGQAEVASGQGDILGLAHENGARTVVSGSYYAEGDSLQLLARITDARDSRLMDMVGPVVGSLSAPRELVTALGEQVVARLASLLDYDLRDYEPTVQPATYEVYEAFSEGRDAMGGLGGPLAAGRHFERAVAIDTTFYRAMLWAAHSYIWAGPQYHERVESWIAKVEESRAELTRYERARLDFVIAEAIRPSVQAAYEAAHRMARAAPGLEQPKHEIAFLSLRSFRPRETIEVLEGLTHSPAGWELLCHAYHMLGEHEAGLETAREGLRQFPGYLTMVAWEAKALVALGRVDEVKARLPAMLPLRMVAAYVADELRVHGYPAAARELLDSAIAWHELRADPQGDLKHLLYRAERWEEAWELAQEQDRRYPNGLLNVAFLGVVAARRGDREAALRFNRQLESISSTPLVRGWHKIQHAKIAALLGDSAQAVDLLRQGLDQATGWNYTLWPHRDMDFDSLRDFPPFQELIRPKG
jgi:DNA-binding SARP family transcriptional activator